MKIAIAGGGKLGTALVEALLGGGNQITVIDTDEERIKTISNAYDVFTMCADAREISVLNDLPVNEYNLFIAATSDDELNIVMSSFAKKLGCPQVVARVRAPEHIDQHMFIMDTMKIDYLLNPDLSCAKEISHYLTKPYAIDGGRFDIDGITVLEIPVQKMPQLTGKQLKDASQLLEGFLVAAVSREGKIIIPNGQTVFSEEDSIYILGLEAVVSEFAKKLHNIEEKPNTIKRIMIAGGGNTGYFLAKILSSKGLGIKLIEKKKSRCEYLSGVLNNVLILNGDATDANLLQEENLDSMDAFVAITGYDEENLLLSLLAKKAGVNEIVTKLSSRSYAPLTDNLGVAMTINPLDMCAADMLHFIRKDGVVLFNKMINGQAEFKEIMATDAMPFTGKRLCELSIPEGILIAAIYRNGEIIIPRGNSRVMPKDKVLILSLLSSAAELEGMLSNTKTSVL